MSKRPSSNRLFLKNIESKLAVLTIVILLIFVLLGLRVFAISHSSGERYKRQVLSQQEYDSITLPAKRGEITDRNGTKIAVSQKVYNIIVDAKDISSDEGKYLDETLNLLYSSGCDFRISEKDLRKYILDNPDSRYKIIAKKQPYDKVNELLAAKNDKENYPLIKGFWEEEVYIRSYPYGSLACDVVGFVQGDNAGTYGLEEYYDDTLKGINGREYGYLNDDENLERTTKSAEDGKTLKTSLDVNIQSIVEKHILNFNKEHENEHRDGYGSNNTGVIIMNPNTGEIMAMASYPNYDLNDPRNEENIKYHMAAFTKEYEEKQKEELEKKLALGLIDESDLLKFSSGSSSSSSSSSETEENVTSFDLTGVSTKSEKDAENELSEEESEGEEVLSDPSEASDSTSEIEKTSSSEEEKEKTFEELYELEKTEAFNALWKNYCINSTYEPGSTMKPFTMAMGLEEGRLTGNESYVCNGVTEVGDHKIHCSNRLGHGPLTFSGALENSCNVCFMKMGAVIGKEQYLKYFTIFNFGLKTNIDLTGEALTNSLVFNGKMNPTDLAVGSFGQGFNVTMIQIANGFCSLINGGKYYQPHIVTEIVDKNGATYEKIEPRVLKQTISEETSDKIKELCVNVVSLGTGKSARPAGYMIGGKTGTAETLPRGNGEYVVSFIGFAPSDDPELVIYTVIDRPNVAAQASAKYATVLTRDILTEVLDYLNVPKTEEITEKEAEELKEKQIEFSLPAEEEEVVEAESTETSEESVIEIVDSNGNPVNQETTEEETIKMPTVKIDKTTGYAIDPSTGAYLDPETGQFIDETRSNLVEQENSAEKNEDESSKKANE